jgi:hypothetical protein
MSRRTAFVLAVSALLVLSAVDASAGAVLLSAGVSVADGSATQQTIDDGPAVSVTSLAVTVEGEILEDGRIVDEAPLSEGGTVTTSHDPTITLGVRADSPIEVVSIRVDGETRRTYSPDAESFQRSEEIDLKPRENEVRIVVKANETTTRTGTILKDNRAPLMTFESPFEAGFVNANGTYSAPNETYTIEDAQVTLAGTFRDETGIEKVRIERTYRTTTNGSGTIYNRSRTTIEEPGESIAYPLRLGPAAQNVENGTDIQNGTNTVRLTAFDRFEQRRVYEVDLLVEDSDAPEIDLHRVSTDVTNQSVTFNFTVTDRVGIESVGYRRGFEDEDGLRYLIFGRRPMSQPLQQTFNETIRVTEEMESLTLVAEDGVGNVTTQTQFVRYDRLVTPDLRLVSAEHVGENRVRIRGGASDGQITRVHAEVVKDGEILDIRKVYDGDVRERIRVDETLTASSFPVTVRIRVTDATGEEHVESAQLTRDEAVTPSEPTATPATRTPVSSPTPSSTPADQIVVRNATLSESEVSPGEVVFVNATVENRGDGNTLYTAGLSAGGAVVTTEPVTLPAGEKRPVSFRYEANETGTVPVAINGTSAGTLTVGGGGIVGTVLGFLAPVLGILPLGLLRTLAVFVLAPVLLVFLILKGVAVYLGY